MAEDDAAVRLACIVALAVIVVVSIVSMTFVAVLTDRDLWRAEVLTFLAVLMLASLGGVSWWQWRRHHYRVRIERDGSEDHQTPQDAL